MHYSLQLAPLVLMFAFCFKHFVCDFPLQIWPYQYANKKYYGHPGGILHASIHGIGTFLILLIPFFQPVLNIHPTIIDILFLASIDAVIHYHIDWAKMNLNDKYGWKPHTSSEFWILLGVDQLLHSLTYVGIIWILVKG